MKESFSNSLRQFALAVDIVDEQVLKDVMRLIREYVRMALHMEVCVLFTRHEVNGKPGLITTAGYKWSQALMDDNGNHNGQVSFAFTSRKSLWIVSKKDGNILEDTETGYIDCFNNAKSDEIPPYISAGKTKIRTSVYMPIRGYTFEDDDRFYSRNSEIMGILSLESSQYIKCTSVLRNEVIAISDALSQIYRMMETHTVQTRGTQLALKTLENVLNNNIEDLKRKPLVGKLGLFLATPGDSSDDVIGIIREVLKDYSDVITPYFWKQDTRSGNIHAQLWSEIQGCQCGIFYLSQPADNGQQHAYSDNPNVLFEAGMMHALISDDPTLSSLIIIREEDSPDIPFDILAERRLTVPREHNGQLIKESFRDGLRLQLKHVLGRDG